MSKKIVKSLIYLAPIVFFFSYYPVFTIASTDSMNLEFNLPELWLIIFCIFSLPSLKSAFNFYRDQKKFFLIFLFPLYATLSIIWSPNRLRALLTAGLLILSLYAALMLFFYFKTMLKKSQKALLLKIFLISSVAVCIFCWFQCFLDLIGVSNNYSLLCPGCTSLSFGFPHPNGFAIEPQFMGNLLLAPALLSLYLTLKSKKYLPLTLFITATLFLTFSRGAIYAYGIAILLLIVITLLRRVDKRAIVPAAALERVPHAVRGGRDSDRKSAKRERGAQLLLARRASARGLLPFVCIPVVSFIIVLFTQGIFSALSPTNTTFTDGISASINQLSLGIIDLKPVENSEEQQIDRETLPVENSVENSAPVIPENTSDENAPVFTGYVEKSTTTRLDLNKYALDVWNDSPANLLFGTGLGSAGTKLYEKSLTSSPKEIIQNQYFSILLELGLIGLALFALSLWIIIKLFFLTALERVLIIAYLFTLSFFSGLPNALHLFIFPLFLLLAENNPFINKEIHRHRHNRT